MKIVAVTGGVGAGKSTVRELFEEEGARGIDADELARRSVEPGSEGAAGVLSAFGPDFFDNQGRLDRKKMARLVFADESARRRLEEILHPIIRSLEKESALSIQREDPGAIVVVEIPLLAEGGRAARYDAVVVVTAPEAVRVDRLVKAGRYTQEEARARIRAQVGDAARAQVSDHTVDNSGSVNDTRRQVRRLLKELAAG